MTCRSSATLRAAACGCSAATGATAKRRARKVSAATATSTSNEKPYLHDWLGSVRCAALLARSRAPHAGQSVSAQWAPPGGLYSRRVASDQFRAFRPVRPFSLYRSAL